MSKHEHDPEHTWEDDGGRVLPHDDKPQTERPAETPPRSVLIEGLDDRVYLRWETKVIRCKFQCTGIKIIEGPVDSPPTHIVAMEARYCPEVPEGERFTKWTPSGTLEVTITNPEAVKQLRVGEQYYIDLERVPTE